MNFMEVTTSISEIEEVETARWAFLNNCAACGTNVILIVISTWILMYSKNFQKFLKIVIIVLNFFQICFSILFIVACPMFGAIDLGDDFVGLMMVNAGIQMPLKYSMALLMLAIIFLTQLIFNSPIFYYLRYLEICRRGIHSPHIIQIIILNIIFLTLSSGALCFAACPTLDDIIHLSGMAVVYVGHETAFLVLSYDKEGSPVIGLISGITYCVMLVFSVILMVFCHYKINSKVRSNHNMSENLRRMQKIANQILYTQFIITIIFIQLPFFYSVLGPLVGLSGQLATYLLSFLFVWGPVANSVGLFIFKTEVQQLLFRCFKYRGMNVVNVGTEMRSAISKI